MSLHPPGRAALSFAAAAFFGVGAPAAGAAADPQRIGVVGDLHGDFAAWRAIARNALLKDERGRWTGGAAVLVKMGDFIGRGPEGRWIVLAFMRLQRETRETRLDVTAKAVRSAASR